MVRAVRSLIRADGSLYQFESIENRTAMPTMLSEAFVEPRFFTFDEFGDFRGLVAYL